MSNEACGPRYWRRANKRDSRRKLFDSETRHTRLTFQPLNFFCQSLNKIYRVSFFLAPSHPSAIRSDFTLPFSLVPSFPPFILFDQATIRRSLPRTIVKQCQHAYTLSGNNAEIWMCTSVLCRTRGRSVENAAGEIV
jgi:hypothetical protein